MKVGEYDMTENNATTLGKIPSMAHDDISVETPQSKPHLIDININEIGSKNQDYYIGNPLSVESNQQSQL